MSKDKDNVIGINGSKVITQETVNNRLGNAVRLMKDAGTGIKNFGEDTLAKPMTPLAVGGLLGCGAGVIASSVAGLPGVGLVVLGIGVQSITDMLTIKSFQLRGYEMVKVKWSRLEQELNQPLPMGSDDEDGDY